MSMRFPTLALLVALTAPGCGGGEKQVAVYPVSGTVTRGGKPFAGASLQFVPANPAPTDDPALLARVVQADDQGKFALSTYQPNDGAPAGDYVVTVRPPSGPEAEERDGPAPRVRVDPALAKYAKPETSPFKVTVKPGDNAPLTLDVP